MDDTLFKFEFILNREDAQTFTSLLQDGVVNISSSLLKAMAEEKTAEVEWLTNYHQYLRELTEKIYNSSLEVQKNV